MSLKNKRVIYQVLPRLFRSVDCNQMTPNGSLEVNGCGKFDDINDEQLANMRKMGFTDLWLTGVIRHSSGTTYPELGLDASHPDLLKGKAGSPYAIKDYYDIDPDLASNPGARMDEFESLIDRANDQGMGILIDFVPNHVARDYCSVAKPDGIKDLGEDDLSELPFHPDNNFYYLPQQELVLPGKGRNRKKTERFTETPAKVSGNNVFHAKPNKTDWYETTKLNFGINYQDNSQHFYPIPDTWTKMLEILNFWAEKGISGFRCDMAGMVPTEFWDFAISAIKTQFPKIVFIAELYEAHRYQAYLDAGFDYLYDKVGMYDTVRAIMTDQASTRSITDLWLSLNGNDNKMLRFLENHDEQRIASKHFAGDARKGLPGLALATMMNGGPAMIYFGQELGEKAEGSSGFSGDDGRTSIFDYTCVPSICDQLADQTKTQNNQGKHALRREYTKILLFAGRNPVFTHGQFYDLMWMNEDLPEKIRHQLFAFLRYHDNFIYLIAICFNQATPAVRIQIGEQAFQTMGLNPERINYQELHPGNQKGHLLYSQVTDTGIQVVFNSAGWSVIRLSC